MIIQTNKLFFSKIFTFILLKWIYQWAHEANISGISWNNINNLNNAPSIRLRRLLYSEKDIYYQKRYNSLKKNAMKIVNEDEYNFGNKLNSLLENINLPKNFKTLLYDEKVPISSDLFVYNVGVKYFNDSLNYDNHKTESGELKKESFQMKKHKTGKKTFLSRMFKLLKKLDTKYEKEVIKLLSLHFNTNNQNEGKSEGSIIKNLLMVFAPLYIAKAMIILFSINNYTNAALTAITLLFISLFYISFKFLKNIKKSNKAS
ncbi:Plasmodium exported protein, unknown function [Plasmodium malariae]|uniref:Pv-fam-d protein n=1 Tax=Plasmodium malariae TaxID=5858 RepID=A0A1A8W499_PLAMA|nr:Plasmodium exported protein, unknown function [Plasmodium malariae]SBS85979.1 Plasmodium exported protein, unknown function [Plasmodium malariae]SBT86172.1 Plasmodium exported protein, unknown function [Plasmodium malariae]